MKIFESILIFIITFVLTYGIAAFIKFDYNLVNYTHEQRFGIIFGAIILTLCYISMPCKSKKGLDNVQP